MSKREGTVLRRETQKFKRFYPPQDSDKTKHKPDDNWEDRNTQDPAEQPPAYTNTIPEQTVVQLPSITELLLEPTGQTEPTIPSDQTARPNTVGSTMNPEPQFSDGS